MIRRLLYWIGRAIGTYNPAPLDFPQPSDYFLLRTVPDLNGGRACEVCRRRLIEGQCVADCDLAACPFNS